MKSRSELQKKRDQVAASRASQSDSQRAAARESNREQHREARVNESQEARDERLRDQAARQARLRDLQASNVELARATALGSVQAPSSQRRVSPGRSQSSPPRPSFEPTTSPVHDWSDPPPSFVRTSQPASQWSTAPPTPSSQSSVSAPLQPPATQPPPVQPAQLTAAQLAAVVKTHEQDPAAAQLALATMSGMDTYGQLDSSTSAVRDRLVSQTPVSDDTKEACIRDFHAANPHDTSIEACSSCGVLQLDVPLELRPVAALRLLELTPHQVHEYLSYPEFVRPVFSIYPLPPTSDSSATRYFHLDPALVRNSTGAAASQAPLCRDCTRALHNGKKPSYSISAGFDYGRPAALGLPSLSVLEAKLISPVCRYMHVYKLSGGQTALHGHVVSVEHTGSHAAAAAVQAHVPRTVAADISFTVLFAGPRSVWDGIVGVKGSEMRKHFRTVHTHVFSVRAGVIREWLAVLALVNPYFAGIDLSSLQQSNEALQQQLDDLVDHVIETADCVEASAAAPPVAPDVSRPAATTDGSESAVLCSAVMPRADAALAVPVDAVLRAAAALLPQAGHSANASADSPTDSGPGAGAQGLPAAASSSSSASASALAQAQARSQAPDQARAAAPTSAADTHEPVHAQASRSVLNELERNKDVIAGGFVHLFVLGRGVPSNGTQPQSWTRRMLLHHSMRFARSPDIIFLLFSQMQRHAAAQNVRARSHAGCVDRLLELVRRADFQHHLHDALADPQSPAAVGLARQLRLLLTICGGHVPWSPAERASTASKLMSYVRVFGLPSLFLTISFNDIDSSIVLRLADLPAASPSASAEDATRLQQERDDARRRGIVLPLGRNPHMRERFRAVATNPVTAAVVFDRMLRGVAKHLLKLSFADDRRSTDVRPAALRDAGVLGHVLAHAGVLEEQQRGSLHYHGLIWVSELQPRLMQRFATDPFVAVALGNVVDSVLQAFLSPEQWELAAAALQPPAGVSSLSQSAVPTRRADRAAAGPISDPPGYALQHALVVQTCGTHSHTAACVRAGQPHCRFGMPQPLNPDPTTFVQVHRDASTGVAQAESYIESPPPSQNLHVTLPDADSRVPPLWRQPDGRPIALQPHRPPPERNGSVVGHCPAITVSLACNTALESLGNSTSALSALFYCSSYMSKNPMPMDGVLRTAAQCVEEVQKRPSVADDTGTRERTALHTVSRMLNMLAGAQQVSAQMASAALMGTLPFVASHSLWFLYSRPAITFALAQHSARPPATLPVADLPRPPSPLDVPSYTDGADDNCDAEDDAEDGGGDDGGGRQGELDLDDDDERVCRRLGDEAGYDPDTDEQVADAVDADAAEVLQLARDATGRIVNVPQHLHYRHRGHALADMSLYEWASLVVVVPKLKADASASAGSDPSDDADDDGDDAALPADDAAGASASASDQQQPARKAGRRSNARFPFDAAHPLALTHEQRLRSKIVVIQLAGRPPPSLPRPSRRRTAAQLYRCQQFAEYYITLLRPWSTDKGAPDIPLTFDSLDQWTRELQRSPSLIDRFRLRLILNAVECTSVSRKLRTLLSEFRSRAATRWTSSNAPPSTAASTAPSGAGALADTAPNGDGPEGVDPAQEAGLLNYLRLLGNQANLPAHVGASEQAGGAYGPTLQSLQTIFGPLEPPDVVQGHESDRHNSVVAVATDAERPTRVWPRLPAAGGGPSQAEAADAAAAGAGAGAVLDATDVFLSDAEAADRCFAVRQALSRPIDDADAQLPAAAPDSAAAGRAAGGAAGAQSADDMRPERTSESIAADVSARVESARAQRGLTDEQTSTLLRALLAVELRAAHCAGQPVPEPEPLRVVIHGGPGAGKSYFGSALMSLAPTGSIVCAAPTAVAARLLPGGRTIHRLLGISGNLRRPSVRRTNQAQAALRGVHLVLLDEMSMLKSSMLLTVDNRLRELLAQPDRPFGGLSIVLMGDFYQLEPVQGYSLYTASAASEDPELLNKLTKRRQAGASNSNGNGGSSADAARRSLIAAGVLFRSFSVVAFTSQMRARDDAALGRLIATFRNVVYGAGTAAPITRPWLQGLRVLSAGDVQGDAAWRAATIVVTTNAERVAINNAQVQRFARDTNQPLVRWCVPLGKRADALLGQMPPAARSTFLESHADELYQFYVPGAPVFLTENFAQEHGLVNGASARLHSIVLDRRDPEQNERFIEAFRTAAPGHVLTLEHTPEFVNVELICSEPDAARWPADATLVPGRVVVPAPRCQTAEEVILVPAAPGREAVKAQTRPMVYDLAFAATFHKVQGQTVERVVLDLNVHAHNGKHSSPSLPSIYVGLSRVRRLEHLRVLPWLSAADSQQNLTRLQWGQQLVNWTRKNIPPPPGVSMQPRAAGPGAGRARTQPQVRRQPAIANAVSSAAAAAASASSSSSSWSTAAASNRPVHMIQLQYASAGASRKRSANTASYGASASARGSKRGRGRGGRGGGRGK